MKEIVKKLNLTILVISAVLVMSANITSAGTVLASGNTGGGSSGGGGGGAMIGDVNGDGIVNIADALLTAQYAAGVRNLTSNQLLLADVDGDNVVNMTDAISISRYTVGLGKGFVTAHKIRFITVGDPHILSNISADQDQRLIRLVSYVNNRTDVDFVVLLGDIVQNSTSIGAFVDAQNILKNLTKPYYMIPGDHDISNVSNSSYIKYFGPMERRTVMNGYQLIFVGMSKDNGTSLHWSFDFSKADKSLPTLVFVHGTVKGAPPNCHCTWGPFFRYAEDMQPELDNFTKLIGVYSGHIHYDSDQTFNGVRYITINGLVNTTGMYLHVPIPEDASNDVGYSVVQGNTLNYSLVPYQ